MANLGEKLEHSYREIISKQLVCNNELCVGLNEAHIMLLDMVDAIAAGQNLNSVPDTVYQNLDMLLAAAHAPAQTMHSVSAQNPVVDLNEDEELIEEIVLQKRFSSEKSRKFI